MELDEHGTRGRWLYIHNLVRLIKSWRWFDMPLSAKGFGPPLSHLFTLSASYLQHLPTQLPACTHSLSCSTYTTSLLVCSSFLLTADKTPRGAVRAHGPRTLTYEYRSRTARNTITIVKLLTKCTITTDPHSNGLLLAARDLPQLPVKHVR